MTTLNDFSVSDFTIDVLAIYYNKLLGSIFRKEFSNAVTMSTDLTLTDGDTPIQRLDCNGANRVVKMAVGAAGNHPVLMINTTSSGSWTLTVKSNDGLTTLKVLDPGEFGFLYPDGNGGYLDIVQFDGSIYLTKDGLTEWDEQASNPSTPASGKWKLFFKAGGLYLIDDAGTVIGPVTTDHGALGGLGDDDHPQYQKYTGYIQENSAQLLYVGAQAYSVLPGSADVNGTLLTWAANIARTGLSLTADTIYYVYLYSSSGTPAVEESTTVPVWDSALNYYKKTGDATRRCIGWIEASATNTLRKFLNTVQGRVSEVIYLDGEDPATDKRVVNGGTVSTSWQSFSLAPLVPSHATHFYGLAKIVFTNSLDDAVLGLSAIDLGSAQGNWAPFDVRDKGAAAGVSTFFGSNWLAISTSQTYYYRLYHVTGTTSTAVVEIHGARIVR